MRIKPATLWIAGMLVLCFSLSVSADSSAPETLEGAHRQAIGQAQDIQERFSLENEEFVRMQQGLLYSADQLDRELADDVNEKAPGKRIDKFKDRIDAIQASESVDGRQLEPVLKALKSLLSNFLHADYYSEKYEKDFLKQLPEELRWLSGQARSLKEVLDLSDAYLVLPETGNEEKGEKRRLPVDIPLDRYLKLDPLTKFIMKHRTGYPKSVTRTTAEDILSGKFNVAVGVEVTGVISRAGFFWGDGDYNFNFGDLHLEITPEWQFKHLQNCSIFHRKNCPRNGQKVRIVGWTYYDSFHKDHKTGGPEKDDDDEFSSQGIFRKIVWEVHPVQKIEILP